MVFEVADWFALLVALPGVVVGMNIGPLGVNHSSVPGGAVVVEAETEDVREEEREPAGV